MNNELDTQNILTELDEYIASGRSRLETILTALDWTIEDTLKESTCKKSSRKKETCDRNDPLLPDSFDCKNSVVIEKHQLQSILNKNNVSIPTKFSDIQLNFTREQKSKIYDYVIANTAKTSEPELKVSCPNDDTDNAMTFAEIVAKAKKKDKKLQRKYRTSKPTHIEEVRNLVHLQMQALEKYFDPHSDAPSPCCDEEGRNSSKSRNEKRSIGESDSHRVSRRDRVKSHRKRSPDRMSPASNKRTKHSKDKKSKDRHKSLVEKKSKKKHKRHKSPKRENKQKSHRNH